MTIDSDWIVYTVGDVARCQGCGVPKDEAPDHDAARCYAPWEHGEAGI